MWLGVGLNVKTKVCSPEQLLKQIRVSIHNHSSKNYLNVRDYPYMMLRVAIVARVNRG
jgi:hypothetical protein